MAIDRNKPLGKMNDKERAQAIDELLIEMHPYLVNVVETLDSDTFWWFYNDYLTLDVDEHKNDTAQRKTIKALRRALLLQFRARYEEEFVERNIQE